MTRALPLLFTLAACTPTGEVTPPGADDTANPTGEPWPDHPPLDGGGLTLVHDGQLLADGDALWLTSAPAGLDEVTVLDFVVTNRTDQAVQFGSADAWLAATGFTWDTPPPTSLEPEASASFSVQVSAAAVSQASELSATLSAPGDHAQLSVELHVDVPPPLRIVAIGTGGYTAISDDYGASFTDAYVPSDPITDRHTLTWGAGRFFHGFASGGDWSDPGRYEWSEDGESWTSAVANDAFWPSHCIWGMERFVCAWNGGIAWSEGGGGVVHEQNWGSLLNHVAYDPGRGRFVFVGRDMRVAISADGQTFESSQAISSDTDDLNAVAQHGGTWVAVGGTNRQQVATSHDGGATWSLQTLHTQQYHSLGAVAHNGVRWVTTGSGWLYTSSDGDTWTPQNPPESLSLLGVAHGRFFALHTPYQAQATLYMSDDGLSWAPVHALAGTLRFHDLATQGWTP